MLLSFNYSILFFLFKRFPESCLTELSSHTLKSELSRSENLKKPIWHFQKIQMGLNLPAKESLNKTPSALAPPNSKFFAPASKRTDTIVITS